MDKRKYICYSKSCYANFFQSIIEWEESGQTLTWWKDCSEEHQNSRFFCLMPEQRSKSDMVGMVDMMYSNMIMQNHMLHTLQMCGCEREYRYWTRLPAVLPVSSKVRVINIQQLTFLYTLKSLVVCFCFFVFSFYYALTSEE